MKENVQAMQQQAKTVGAKALTSSECAHESAGPTSIRVRHKSEQAKQHQAKTGRYEGERTSEERKSDVQGKRVDVSGRRITKKKRTNEYSGTSQERAGETTSSEER